MLVRYKKSFEKLAMGLLSFMPEEKEVKRLMETMQKYEHDDHWQLYLWKKDEEFVGLVGVFTQDKVATIQHITVMPSYRGEGIAMAMLLELSKQYEKLLACEATESFINKCLPIINGADGTI
ncbi:GNAT family N-acetyltransferase [Ureibacillus sp. MALMAid1270]|uniref:GNAT family N-acetyltransferase n=1 Tax=Ureibacillus sp. MALMAid1270 TaxID=3411629 RepID=UPI003BA4BA0E